MKKSALAVIVVVLLAAAVGGYVLVRESRGSANSAYNTSFSEVQPRIVNITRTGCTQNVCSTSIDESVSFPSNPGSSPIAYYPNLILLSNPATTPAEIRSISAVDVGGGMSSIAKISVYYYSSVSEFNNDGTPAGTPPGFCAMTTVLGCRVFSGSKALPGQGQDFIEVVVYTQGGAPGGTVDFTILVESN